MDLAAMETIGTVLSWARGVLREHRQTNFLDSTLMEALSHNFCGFVSNTRVMACSQYGHPGRGNSSMEKDGTPLTDNINPGLQRALIVSIAVDHLLPRDTGRKGLRDLQLCHSQVVLDKVLVFPPFLPSISIDRLDETELVDTNEFFSFQRGFACRPV